MAGDGQATLGESVIFKATSVKVRRIGNGKIIAGFAGAAADGITLIERLEEKLEKNAYQLKRAAVALAKDWRMDKYLRQLQAFMIVADKDISLVISGTGEVMEPDDGIIGIGRMLKEAGLVTSTTDANRNIDQGGVRINGEKVSDKKLQIKKGEVLTVQVGKRRWAKVTVA